MKQRTGLRSKLSYGNVVATLALFLTLGGGAMAASHLGKNSVGAKQLKSNAVTTVKIKKEAVTRKKIKKGAVNASKVADHSLTGTQINLSALGTVPSAETANTANNLSGFKVFSGRGSDESVTVLLSTGQFDVVGLCDPAGTLEAPGFDNGYNPGGGDALGIVNRGQNGGYTDTTDDEDDIFNVGEGVAFDYNDVNDGGSAVLPNGHFIEVLGGVVFDSTENPNFGPGCTFRGMAWFG
jgi:hypothetical protein